MELRSDRSFSFVGGYKKLTHHTAVCRGGFRKRPAVSQRLQLKKQNSASGGGGDHNGAKSQWFTFIRMLQTPPPTHTHTLMWLRQISYLAFYGCRYNRSVFAGGWHTEEPQKTQLELISGLINNYISPLSQMHCGNESNLVRRGGQRGELNECSAELTDFILLVAAERRRPLLFFFFFFFFWCLINYFGADPFLLPSIFN